MLAVDVRNATMSDAECDGVAKNGESRYSCLFFLLSEDGRVSLDVIPNPEGAVD